MQSELLKKFEKARKINDLNAALISVKHLKNRKYRVISINLMNSTCNIPILHKWVGITNVKTNATISVKELSYEFCESIFNSPMEWHFSPLIDVNTPTFKAIVTKTHVNLLNQILQCFL